MNRLIIKRGIPFILVTCAVTVIFSAAVTASDKSNWSNAEAKLSVAEYINLFCLSHLQGYHTTEQLEIIFIANQSPSNAVLYLTQPVVVPMDDLPTRASLRSSLEKKCLLYKQHVDRIFKDPSISTRWKGVNTKDNLIVHIVSAHDPAKTIILFNQGKLVWESDKISQELKLVQSRVGDSFIGVTK